MSARSTQKVAERLEAIRDGFRLVELDTRQAIGKARKDRSRALSPKRAASVNRMAEQGRTISLLARSARTAAEERGIRTPTTKAVAAIARVRELFRQSQGINVEKSNRAQDQLERVSHSAYHTVKAEAAASKSPAVATLRRSAQEIVKVKERNEERVSRRVSGDGMRI